MTRTARLDPSAVRIVIQRYVAALSATGEIASTRELPDDFDLYLSGVVDSLGILGLIAAIQEAFDTDIDFNEMDTDEMTIVGPLCHFVAGRVNSD